MGDLLRAHDALARLLDYPSDGFHERVATCIPAILDVVPRADSDLARFRDWVEGQSLAELEESYTQTFDNSTTRALEVGWHVFGETYDRGAFLVRMRDLMRSFGVAESPELPDHLGHVLEVLGRADKDRAELGGKATLAISKIAAALAEDDNPYVGVLDAAWKLVGTYAAPLEPTTEVPR